MNKLIDSGLWFDGNAAEAAEFYCSKLKDSKIISANPMVVVFESSGHKFICFNGGPQFKFNPSISFFYICETEREIDELWNEFVKEGSVMMPLDKYDWSEKYGFFQDKYGVSWQFSLGNITDVGQTITPAMLFVGEQFGRGSEAVHFYTGVFENSAIDNILLYGEDETPHKPGSVKHAQFGLNGQKFMIMESSLDHGMAFNEAVSFVINCETQVEIDYFWAKLTADGGKESHCGWLKDKFGVSWQVVPTILAGLMNDPEKARKVSGVFMKMKKFDIAALKEAAG